MDPVDWPDGPRTVMAPGPRIAVGPAAPGGEAPVVIVDRGTVGRWVLLAVPPEEPATSAARLLTAAADPETRLTAAPTPALAETLRLDGTTGDAMSHAARRKPMARKEAPAVFERCRVVRTPPEARATRPGILDPGEATFVPRLVRPQAEICHGDATSARPAELGLPDEADGAESSKRGCHARPGSPAASPKRRCHARRERPCRRQPRRR